VTPDEHEILRGQVFALTQICMVLLATHPDDRAIVLVNRLKQHAAIDQAIYSSAKFCEGIATVADALLGGLKTRADSEQVKNLKPGKHGH
jgi:hypothetical protein